MKSSSLCPSLFFYIFSCRMELLEIGWAGAGHHLRSGTESCGGCWHCGKAAATAWECKWQVAVLVSVIPGHPSSKPTCTPMKAFHPFQVRWHCEDDSRAVPQCPGEGGCCGSKGGCGSCPCCLARALLALPTSVCPSVCPSVEQQSRASLRVTHHHLLHIQCANQSHHLPAHGQDSSLGKRWSWVK